MDIRRFFRPVKTDLDEPYLQPPSAFQTVTIVENNEDLLSAVDLTGSNSLASHDHSIPATSQSDTIIDLTEDPLSDLDSTDSESPSERYALTSGSLSETPFDQAEDLAFSIESTDSDGRSGKSPGIPSTSLSEAIAEQAEDLRRDLASMYSDLPLESGAQSTQSAQKRNKADWNTYWRDVLRSPSRTPTGADVFGYIEVLIRKSKPRHLTKSLPSESTIIERFNLTRSYLELKYPTFATTFTRADARRIFGHLDTAVREGRLTRTRHQPRQWLTISVLKTLAQRWIDSARVNGTPSWDGTILALLAVTLQYLLTCRGGELVVGQSQSSDQYLAYRDIEIFNGSASAYPPRLADLVCRITLRWCKNSRTTPDDNKIIHLRAIEQEDLYVVDAFKLILVMALRTGQLQGTIDDVLAALKPGVKLAWKDPSLPVVYGSNPRRSMSYTTFIASFKRFTTEGGLLVDAVPHDLRRGSARDIAFGTAVNGVPNIMSAALALGHDAHTLLLGVTAEYVGPSPIPVNNLIAGLPQVPVVDTMQPVLGSTRRAVDAVPSKRDIDRLIENTPGMGRYHAGFAVKRSRAANPRTSFGQSPQVATIALPLDDITDIISTEHRISSVVTADVTVDLAVDTAKADELNDLYERNILATSLPANGVDWISWMSKINEFKCCGPTTAELDQTTRERGNSRNNPSKFLYKCPNDAYTSPRRDLFVRHLTRCKGKTVLRNPVYSCTWAGCTRAFSSIKNMKAHIVNDHTFSRSCSYQQCSNLPPFPTRAKFDSHRKDVHTEVFPSPGVLCIYADGPACRNPEKLWIPHRGYRQHLEAIHGVSNSREIVREIMRSLQDTSL